MTIWRLCEPCELIDDQINSCISLPTILASRASNKTVTTAKNIPIIPPYKVQSGVAGGKHHKARRSREDENMDKQTIQDFVEAHVCNVTVDSYKVEHFLTCSC